MCTGKNGQRRDEFNTVPSLSWESLICTCISLFILFNDSPPQHTARPLQLPKNTFSSTNNISAQYIFRESLLCMYPRSTALKITIHLCPIMNSTLLSTVTCTFYTDGPWFKFSVTGSETAKSKTALVCPTHTSVDVLQRFQIHRLSRHELHAWYAWLRSVRCGHSHNTVQVLCCPGFVSMEHFSNLYLLDKDTGRVPVGWRYTRYTLYVHLISS